MKTLVVNGSPRGEKASSRLLGTLLADGLRERDVEVTSAWALGALRDEAASADLLDAWEAADAVVLAFPLYVDSLPAPLTHLLELVAERRARDGHAPAKTRQLAVMVQCGFPEAFHCDTAVAICRNFARSAGMAWAGAVSMGQGGSLGGGLEKIPPKGAAIVRESVAALAGALAAGRPLSAEQEEAARRPLMPAALYVLGGNVGWRIEMRRHRTKRGIAYRPYAGRV